MRCIGRLLEIAAALLPASLMVAPACGQQAFTMLGVLEDTPGLYVGDPHCRSVRIVSYKDGTEWKKFPVDCGTDECLEASAPKYPAETTWTIAFDGSNVGTVISHAPSRLDTYSSVGQQRLADERSAPAMGKPCREFAGWLSANVYRPLVANSQPFFKDPEQWKRSELSSEVVGLLRRQFRQKFSKVTNCANPEDSDPKPRPYHDDDIKIVAAYSSREHWSVVRLQLEPYRCDGPADDPFIDQWYALSPTHEVKFLDKAMWLVDAGDYDNDGRSELVFSVDDYDLGGYRLFYDHFEKKVAFEFSYH